MIDSHHFLLFLAAALVLAIAPGPGIFYVLARTLAGGRREGIESSLGTFFGGLFHVFAAALGVSAILAASAVAFHTVKYAGAAYLVWLGIRMIRARNAEMPAQTAAAARFFPPGHPYRSAESEDSAVLLVLHSAVHSRRTGTRVSSVHRSGRDFGVSEHHRRSRGGVHGRPAGAQAEK